MIRQQGRDPNRMRGRWRWEAGSSRPFGKTRAKLVVGRIKDEFELGLTWRRDYTQDRDFRRENTFLLRVAPKNLGR